MLAYRFGSNKLRLLGEYRTGGTGTIDPGITGSIDAADQIAVDRARRLLFAVNQGSDTIAVFRIGRDGSARHRARLALPSGGRSPASVGIAGDMLVVINKAHDPRRTLSAVRPAYVALRNRRRRRALPRRQAVHRRGRLVADPGADDRRPGHRLDREIGPFRAFVLGADGSLRQAPNSPLQPETSIFEPRYDGARWAIGLVPHPTRRLLYANQAATEQLLVYRYDLKAS